MLAGVRGHARQRSRVQIAGVDHLAGATRRHARQLGQRVEDLRQAIDPDLVVEIVERREHVLALATRLEQAHGLVHDVAQAEDQARAAVLEHDQRVARLAAQAERLLVDDEQVSDRRCRRCAG